MKNNEINIVATRFAENHEKRAVLDAEMAQQKTLLVDYAVAHPLAFVGKRLSFAGGVCVQRNVRQQVRFDRAKVTPEWLRAMQQRGNAAAVDLRLDPRKLRLDDEATRALLDEVGYLLETREVMSVTLPA